MRSQFLLFLRARIFLIGVLILPLGRHQFIDPYLCSTGLEKAYNVLSFRLIGMLHARLSTRPTSFRKSNITAVSEYPPQFEDDDSNYTANLHDCVLALGDCGKQVRPPQMFPGISEWPNHQPTFLGGASQRDST